VVLQQVQRVDTVARRADLVAGPGEGIRCDGPDMRIVIHDYKAVVDTGRGPLHVAEDLTAQEIPAE
jgi:hypothetical protein